MIELELWNHEQALSHGILFHFFSCCELSTGNSCRHYGLASILASSFLFAEHCEMCGDKVVERQRVDGDLCLRKNVEHVKLIRH